MLAYFNRFTLSMTRSDAGSATHPGDCLPDVRLLLQRNKNLVRQLDKIDPDDIRAELKEYGAWDADELADNDANRERIVWIAAGNINNEIREKRTNKQ